ncbi:MAG: methyl-accepting chemotaxis protein [Desulfobulbaceae bacterium]|nr:methyl-accepting chemotaxis protein [Desulfobulbaceae bacterium]
MKFRTQLFTGNGLVLALLVVISVVVYQSVTSLNETSRWVEHTHEVIGRGNGLVMSLVNMETGERGFMVTGEEGYLEPYHQGKEDFAKLIAEAKQLVSDNPQQVGRFEAVEKLARELDEKVLVVEIETRRQVGKAVDVTMDDIVAMMGKGAGKKYMDELRQRIGEIISIEQGLMGERQEAAKATARRTINITIFGTLLAILLGVAIVVLLTKNTMRQLGGEPAYIAGIAHSVAKGDLSMRLDSKGEAVGIFAEMQMMVASLKEKAALALEIAQGNLNHNVKLASEQDVLGQALKEMTDNLNQIIGEINVATDQVTSGASQVSDSSQALSQGATEQAASLEQITSSMTEMGSQTKLNAENASQANQLAGQTRTAAEGGNAKMQEMVAAMGEINEAGRNISKIIKVIDEIAFQTNLLALNAAVEAARAGRHGKGFAVVAEEVRNLAARSAKAAKETAELIEGSVEKTKNGTAIAEATSEALAEIVASVTKVTDLVGEIAAASNEQAQGINQTNQALNQIDQITQQNTASAEESAAASEELSGQAMHMKEMMARFKLRDVGQGLSRQQALLRPAAAPRKEEGWGGASPSPKGKEERPHEVITLDDKEFGKY